jgi:hypothetical protein
MCLHPCLVGQVWLIGSGRAAEARDGDADYAFGRGGAEYERLIDPAEICRPLTERMLRSAGIGAGMHVLDVSCGAGGVSFLVSALVGPEGSVIPSGRGPKSRLDSLEFHKNAL